MKMHSGDNVIEDFYLALVEGDGSKASRIHIPRSDVFYVREAIKNRTGVEYSLDRIERAMYLEGHLKAHDVFEPERQRDWEVPTKQDEQG